MSTQRVRFYLNLIIVMDVEINDIDLHHAVSSRVAD